MRKYVLLFLTIIFGLLLFGCKEESSIEEKDKPIEEDPSKDTPIEVVEDILPEEIVISNKISEMIVGEIVDLGVELLPSDSSDLSFTVTSSNDGVIRVSDGRVEALSEGTVTITIKANACDLKMEFPVFVKDRPKEEIILKEYFEAVLWS